ncbi:thioredoxin family protein [Flavobacterium antarcticum]|uniref:thioredoxin family protein n=1 Tax=Flavobacterium antarcticum TaxID=271155 RepID=UPI0012FAC8A7|nr:thioredoxin family protein [Flavobacterium antarcticum]
MKNIYLAFFILSGLLLNAQVVFESSLVMAFKKAKQQNKPVFIEYYNSDCSVCKRLGAILREDAAVASYYNANFIGYAMNTYDDLSKEDKMFMEEANLNFESVPVLLYFDQNKNFLHHSNGQIDEETVVNEAKKALNPMYNSSGLKTKYEAGDRSVRTLYAYSDVLRINKNEALLQKVAQELFESFNKAELPTKKSYIILKQVVTTSDNGFFQYWINNLDGLKGFEKGIHEGTEQSHLQTIVLKELTDPNLKSWNTTKINQFKAYILKLKITDNPNVFFEQS